MSSRFHRVAGIVALAAMLAISSRGLAQSPMQSDDVEPELRVQQLENQLRQLTGQNEELQFRNRQLEEQIRQLQAGNPGASARPNAAAIAAAPPAGPPRQLQQQPGDEPQVAAPPPIVQEQPADQAPPGRRRGDAFDPNQNPNAP